MPGAVCPNPVQTEITITYKLSQAEQVADLRFTNLLTGKVQVVVPIEYPVGSPASATRRLCNGLQTYYWP